MGLRTYNLGRVAVHLVMVQVNERARAKIEVPQWRKNLGETYQTNNQYKSVDNKQLTMLPCMCGVPAFLPSSFKFILFFYMGNNTVCLVASRNRCMQACAHHNHSTRCGHYPVRRRARRDSAYVKDCKWVENVLCGSTRTPSVRCFAVCIATTNAASTIAATNVLLHW